MKPLPGARSWWGQQKIDLEAKWEWTTNSRFNDASLIQSGKEQTYRCDCHGSTPQQIDWTGITTPITFAYRFGTNHMGSIRLRGHQVADMLTSLGAPVPVTVQPLETAYRRRLSGHTLIVLKTALKARLHPLLRSLRRRDNTIVFDAVDGVVPPKIEDFPAAYVCSSLAENFHRQQRRQHTILSLHATDVRIPASTTPNSADFSVGYMGLAENAPHLEMLSGVFSVPYRETQLEGLSPEFLNAFQRLSHFSHHYVVRAWNSRDGYKPLTKAFVAARMGAVVIASAEDEESRLTLGDDYPYLARSSSLQDVREVIDYAEQTHLGPEWHQAVSKMHELRHMSCPVKTAQDLVAGLRGLTN